jgi:hypothetical protein
MDDSLSFKTELFLSLGSGLKTIETQVEVVWTDIPLNGGGEIRTGVKFIDISLQDLEILKDFQFFFCFLKFLLLLVQLRQ